ncbi:MAG: dienelactone hydrolase family protein [Burkholderiales bacterium]
MRRSTDLKKRTTAIGLAALALAFAMSHGLAATPETVRFPSADGKTTLVGYLYRPDGPGPHPAIVLLHGRSGPYSSLKRGIHTAEALSGRHRMWGTFWASRGYAALLVDSFGPRGYGDGFPKHSYRERPPEVSEQSVRPLDAHGALAYLRTRSDVAANRVGVHGWSNGGMTVLAALDAGWAEAKNSVRANGFKAALAQYPSCRAQARQESYKPNAPLLILAAAEDDEVSPEVCRRFAEALRERGEPVEFVVYEGAHHSYDDPGKTKQSHEPNRVALKDSLKRAEAFFTRHLKAE